MHTKLRKGEMTTEWQNAVSVILKEDSELIRNYALA